MSRSWSTPMLTACLVLACIIASAAPRLVAIVSAGPDTTVNGTSVSGNTAAFPEDDVETHSNNSATMTFAGNALIVLGNSHVKLAENAAILLNGGAVVSTNTRLTVQSGCFSAQPVDTTYTLYSVLTDKGQIYVRAERGAVTVKTRRQLHLPSGKTAAIAACGTPEESVKLVGSSQLPLKMLIGSAAVATAAAPFAFGGDNKCKEPISSEAPASRCR